MIERVLGMICMVFFALCVALAVAAYGLRSQLATCRASTAVLTQAVEHQNKAAEEAERKAAEAARRGALARREAAGAVEVAKASADRLARVLGAPRPDSTCPSADALEVVREDLADR